MPHADSQHHIATTELTNDLADLTIRLLRARSEIQELIAGTHKTIAESQRLIDEVNAALAGGRPLIAAPRREKQSGDGWNSSPTPAPSRRQAGPS